jgi:hypothetical protein
VEGETTIVHETFYERQIGGEDGQNAKSLVQRYSEIANTKARMLVGGYVDSDRKPFTHLLFPGDTHYAGAVMRDGIIVAFSGVQEYFDVMISAMIAEGIIAMAQERWVTSFDSANNVPIIPAD